MSFTSYLIGLMKIGYSYRTAYIILVSCIPQHKYIDAIKIGRRLIKRKEVEAQQLHTDWFTFEATDTKINRKQLRLYVASLK